MTNKDQLIQEMASDMNYATVKHDLWPDDAKEIAKTLILLGYDKVPEGSVVYTKEDQEDMKISIRHEIYCECNKARKETAEKWYCHIVTTLLTLWKDNKITTEIYNSWILFFNSLAKQFGVEVK